MDSAPADAQGSMAPPPRPPSSSRSPTKRLRDDDEDAGSEASAAKRSCGASSGFTDLTRDAVKRLYGECCWHCRASPVDVAHVLPKADRRTFLNLKERRLIALRSLSDEENAIPLCGTCHHNFDRKAFGLVIVPTNLDYLIDTELRHRSQRGPRYPLVSVEYKAAGGGYQAYVVWDYMPRLPDGSSYGTGAIYPARDWEGDPVAMVHRAFSLLGMTTVTNAQVPQLVQRKLQRLRDLYSEEDNTTLAASLPANGPSDPDANPEHDAQPHSAAHSSTPPPPTSQRPDAPSSREAHSSQPYNENRKRCRQPSHEAEDPSIHPAKRRQIHDTYGTEGVEADTEGCGNDNEDTESWTRLSEAELPDGIGYDARYFSHGPDKTAADAVSYHMHVKAPHIRLHGEEHGWC